MIEMVMGNKLQLEDISKESNNTTNASQAPSNPRAPALIKDPVTQARQLTVAGKLQEIDLGPDAARQNVLHTQAAVFGGPGSEISDVTDSKKGRRRKQRRTSEDTKTDQMVERVLAEARRMLLN
jgi:hypothetical protein